MGGRSCVLQIGTHPATSVFVLLREAFDASLTCRVCNGKRRTFAMSSHRFWEVESIPGMSAGRNFPPFVIVELVFQIFRLRDCNFGVYEKKAIR